MLEVSDGGVMTERVECVGVAGIAEVSRVRWLMDFMERLCLNTGVMGGKVARY